MAKKKVLFIHEGKFSATEKEIEYLENKLKNCNEVDTETKQLDLHDLYGHFKFNMLDIFGNICTAEKKSYNIFIGLDSYLERNLRIYYSNKHADPYKMTRYFYEKTKDTGALINLINKEHCKGIPPKLRYRYCGDLGIKNINLNKLPENYNAGLVIDIPFQEEKTKKVIDVLIEHISTL